MDDDERPAAGVRTPPLPPRPHLAIAAALFALSTASACTTGPTADLASPGSATGNSMSAGASTPPPTGDGTPLLGRQASWSILVGSAEQVDQPLTRLDLDSGEITTYPGVGGGPVAAIRGRLVLQVTDDTTGTAQLRIVPLADPTTQPIEIGPRPPVDVFLGLALPVVRDQGARLWIYHEDDGRAMWSLVDLENGTTSNAIAVGPADGPPPIAGGGPDVVSTGDSGVYRLDDDGYRLLSPGTPIAISAGAILTRTCLSSACTFQWIGEQNGERVDRPTPDGQTQWRTLVNGSDRFLAGGPDRQRSERDPGELRLFDTKDGEEIRPAFASEGGIASSPDGRYLALQSLDGIEVYDADLDRWFPTPVSPAAPTMMAFIPTI